MTQQEEAAGLLLLTAMTANTEVMLKLATCLTEAKAIIPPASLDTWATNNIDTALHQLAVHRGRPMAAAMAKRIVDQWALDHPAPTGPRAA